MTNPQVYPITAEFEREVGQLQLNDIGRSIADRMKAHIGEYEHGTAEPQVLFPDKLRVFEARYFNEGATYEEMMENSEQFLRTTALETMKEMFLDYLRTYWLLNQPAQVTVWMPDDDTALNTDIQEDIIRAVEAAHGHVATDAGWNVIAVGPQPFSGEDASKAMEEASGTEPIKPSDWIEQKTGE